MSNDWFFEKFSLIADAPGAVERMRGLVLDWALSGKFSQKSEVPFKYVRLDSVADIRMGNSPPGHSYNETGQGVPLINGPVEFSSGPLGLTVRTKFTTSPTKLCKRGDLLICVRGSTTGRTNIAAFDACIGRGVAAITAHDNQIYINLFVWSQRAKIFALGTGSTFPSISHDDLASLELTLPPLAEQKRIAAKVEELMGICDTLEAQQRERESRKSVLVRSSLSRFAEAPTPENLGYLFHKSYDIPPSELRKSILTLAVQGKLVPQDPNDEPAVDLTNINDPLSAESSFELPNGWIWVRLLNLADINGGFAFKSTDYLQNGIRVIRISDFDETGFKDHKIVRHPFTPDLQKFSLAQKNILMAMTGGTVGKSYFVKTLPEPMVVNQRVATIKISPSANPSYIDIVIRSEMTQSIIQRAKNSTNDNISMQDIKGFPIPLPPLAEQRRIVAKVDQLMALVDELERQQEASREKASKLLDAIVQEMTSGGRDIAATLES